MLDQDNSGIDINATKPFTGALELSRQYFLDIALPQLRESFPDLFPRLACGLVGNGSERFGFDDQYSIDHDWGIDFYIWLGEEDRHFIPRLEQWKDNLFKQNPPSVLAKLSKYCIKPGAQTIAEFYQQLIGVSGIPQTVGDWTKAPEENFAMAVNGAVFYDGTGQFSAIRHELLRYYPDDIRLKKMAAICMKIAQSGQYNYKRMAKRGDWVTAAIALARFVEAAMQLALAINRVYRPYYKWLYRATCDLPRLGATLVAPLKRLASDSSNNSAATETKLADIEQISILLADELRLQGLVKSEDNYMATLGEELQASISHSGLRNLPITFEL
jgi:hypothetical protein